MYDTLIRQVDQQPTERQQRQQPRVITKIMCGLATAQCIHVLIALTIHHADPGAQSAGAAALGIPALYLLAQDLMGCRPVRISLGAFRLGIAAGRLLGIAVGRLQRR